LPDPARYHSVSIDLLEAESEDLGDLGPAPGPIGEGMDLPFLAGKTGKERERAWSANVQELRKKLGAVQQRRRAAARALLEKLELAAKQRTKGAEVFYVIIVREG
jgi:hypothetical protein